jgi:hypothetical protein
MRSVKIIPGIGREGIKEKDGADEFNYGIL